MTAKAKDAEVAALAGAMLDELTSLRDRGGEAYPPRLRELAARLAGTPTDQQVLKAAAKAAFTAKVVVAEKVNRKPTLDSPVSFKGDEARILAERMLRVLESRRRLGDEAYPPTLRRLAELSGRNASDTLVNKAAAHESMTARAIVASKARGKPSLDARVILRDDLDGGMATVLPALLNDALAPVAGRGKAKATPSTAFTPTEVKARLVPDLQAPILEALERGIASEGLPAGVGWVVTKGKPYLFLLENLRPSSTREARPEAPSPIDDGAPAAPARPARDFAGAFREAFERIDRRNGATNFVKLADLRRALAGFDRDEFDTGLRALRLGGAYSLDSHEGLYGTLTPEEREAGIREAGSLLIYVSRR